MGISVEVHGLAEVLAVRRKLKTVGDAGLGKPMARKLKAAARPIERGVRAEAAVVAPGTYKTVLPRALRFRHQAKTSRVEALLTIRVYGAGRRQHRDVPAVNRGNLRHPLYGNRRHWYVTRIRPGFVDRPFDANKRQVARTVGEVLDEFVDDIKGR